MLSLLIRRIAYGLLTLWLVSVLVFAGTEILPGDVATARLGQAATPETVAALRKELNLDRPLTERYQSWFEGLLRGDLGTTYTARRPVSTMVARAAERTFLLAALTAAVAIPLGLALGLLAAAFPNSVLDRGISIATLSLISVPEFVIAAILVMGFAVYLRWLPAIAGTSGSSSLLETFRALALPILTLTATMLAHLTRLTRAAVISVQSSPYIQMAVLKGLPRHRIVLRHALPNVLAPVINVVALNLAYLVTGVVVVEIVFAYPGLGKLLVDAVAGQDIPLVQACVMIFVGTYVALNLLADMASIAANPQLRRSG